MAGGDRLPVCREKLGRRGFFDPLLWRRWWGLLRNATRCGGVEVDRGLQPGQLATGIREAAEQLNASPSKVFRGLRLLQEWGQIRLENVKQRFSVITICNWETYQCDADESETPVKHCWNTDETPVKPLLL